MTRTPIAVAALIVGLTVSSPRDGASQPVQQDRSSNRPRIGLALGGGAARGLAHIGVLEWLEEHRVPVDAIAGTSVGGLVGGAYAAGLSPAELRALMRATDWDAMFQADSRFTDKTFRRKQDKRAYPARLEFGLRRHVMLPRGLNPGQAIALLLDRLALPYYDLERFDELPTPFRCLAMDLRTARPVVLQEGALSRALRATMAIPGVFTPVSLGDWLLVDGGTLNNVPGDLVRDMGADIVIAVDVSSAGQGNPAARLESGDLITVLDRTLDAMMAAGARRGLDAASVVLVPDLGGLDSMSWRRGDDLADRGYRAAAALAERLLPYAMSETEFAAHMAARRARRRTTLPTLKSVAASGVGLSEQQEIRERLADNVGRAADPDRIERGINRLAGTDRYESIDYGIATGPDGPGLLLTVQTKTYGPPFLALGVDLNNLDASHTAANLSARLTAYDAFGAGSEVRNDMVVGTRQALASEVFAPLGRSPFFVAPRVSVVRQDRTWFDGSQAVAESRLTRAGAGIDLGALAGQSAELRLGLDAAYVRMRPLVGAPVVSRLDGHERFASLRLEVDRQDSPVVPSRGLFLRAQVRRFFDTPGVQDGTAAGPRRFWQADGTASIFGTLGSRHRVFAQVAGGSSFGAKPAFEDFTLGGPLRLGALNPEEVRGAAYALGVAGYLKKTTRLPEMLGGDVYLGTWIETGSAFQDWTGARWHNDVSGGVVMESIIGPIFAGGSLGFDGRRRLYVSIGQLWR